jgi:transposase-like protein
MEKTSFERLLARVGRDLSPEQHIELRDHLDTIEGERATDIALGARSRDLASARRCPHCGASGAVKHGHDKLGRQRFRCRKAASAGCGRTFNALTGTPLARMRKPDRWHAFAKALADGFISVDRLQEQDLGISRLTIWRWRNRLLAAQVAKQAEQLRGVVEADETYFKTSFKGSRGWKRGNPPANRPPRYRGAPAIKRGLSKEQIPVLPPSTTAGTSSKRRSTTSAISAPRCGTGSSAARSSARMASAAMSGSP